MDITRDILPLKNTMFRLALRITQDSQEAEDVVQDVVLKLWHSRDTLDKVDNLEAYAIRMTRNTAISHQRLRANSNMRLDDVSPDDVKGHSAAAEVDYDNRERLQNVRDIMATLPEAQRTAMHLRDFEGYSYKEIAEMTQLSEDQVKVYIFRARQFVKSKMDILSADMQHP